MVTTTTTIVTIPTTPALCAYESEQSSIFNFKAIYTAWYQCRRRKRGTMPAQDYAMALFDKLLDTNTALFSHKWRCERSVCFTVTHPKAREIHAPSFNDRVVHHLLIPHLEILFEPIFIYDSYANRQNKGTHLAVKRLAHFMRAATHNGQGSAWYLQLDIANFFNSIDHAILLQLLIHRINIGTKNQIHKREELIWLCQQIIYGATNTRFVGNPKLRHLIPEHKHLGATGTNKGLPIGNLTSQFFANVYLNELDQFIKHQLKVHWYIRYVDDFILIHTDPIQLHNWLEQINNFLTQHLTLKLKSFNKPRLVTDGADFLGYIIRPFYRLVRKRVIGHLRQKLHLLAKQLFLPPYRILDLKPQIRDKLHACLASYFGHFSHARHYHLVKSLFNEFPWLTQIFTWDPGPTLIPLWEPPVVTSCASQYRYFQKWQAPTIILMQIGKQAVCPAKYITHWPEALIKLGRMEKRLDLGMVWALPLKRLQVLWRRIKIQRISLVFISEQGYLRNGLKRRVFRKYLLFSCLNQNLQN